MKIKPTYPISDPKQLKFMNPGQEGISLIFAKRLSAFAKDKGKVLYISSGYRDVVLQKKLYDENCRQHPPSGNGYVAKPGNSWHNGRCAVDIDNRGFWKAYMENGDMKRSIKNQELYKYGLCLPLNHVDDCGVYEWWHIQPIETIGYTGDRTKFLDADDKIFNPKEVDTVTAPEALKVLQENGVINSPDYWLKAIDVTKNLDLLIINMANKLKGVK